MDKPINFLSLILGVLTINLLNVRGKHSIWLVFAHLTASGNISLLTLLIRL